MHGRAVEQPACLASPLQALPSLSVRNACPADRPGWVAGEAVFPGGVGGVQREAGAGDGGGVGAGAAMTWPVSAGGWALAGSKGAHPGGSRARSGNPAVCGAIGLADLPDKAPAQQEEITKQGIDCVNRCAACPPGGCLVRLGAPVGPLHQGQVEDAGTVAQASRGVAHDASLSKGLDLVSRGGPTVVGGHEKEVDKSFGYAEPATRVAEWGRCPVSAGDTIPDNGEPPASPRSYLMLRALPLTMVAGLRSAIRRCG